MEENKEVEQEKEGQGKRVGRRVEGRRKKEKTQTYCLLTMKLHQDNNLQT